MARHDIYMPLIIGDWLKGTRGMKSEVRGVYISLLLYQWDNGYLPSDMDELMLIDPELPKVWEKIKDKFAPAGAGKLMNEKLEEVRSFFSKQKENGSKGGRPPKPKHNPNNNPDDIPNHNPHNEVGIDNELKDDSNIQGGAGGVLPASQAMVVEFFTGSGLTAEEGEEFYLSVSGRTGWNNIASWMDYTKAAVIRKLKAQGHSSNPNEREEIAKYLKANFRQYRPQEAAKFDREHTEGVDESELIRKRDRIVTGVVEKFWNYYQAQGWKKSGNPITDKLALFKIWMANEKQFA